MGKAMVLAVAQLGDLSLRSQTQPISPLQIPALQPLIEQMIATMEATAGVGIAAPQVGHSLPLIIVASRPTLRYPQAPTMAPIAMVNPQLSHLSPEQDKDWEGCLSVPGLRGLVPRHRSITVHYLDRQGTAQQQTFTDFIARIIQHECDHLSGHVFLDRVESTHDLFTEQEYLKRITP